MTGTPPRRRGRKLVWGLLLAGAAIGGPMIAGAVARRRARPPHPVRWGRTRHYSGKLGEITFQELDQTPGATPLLLLHSLGPGHDADEWRAAAELLRARYHVFAPDLPGWGRSRGPAGGFHPAFYPEVIEEFLRRVVREPAVIVAAGLPAAFAVRVAATAPELVRGLALVAPLGITGERGGEHAGAVLPSLLGLPVLRESVLDLLTSRSALEGHLRGRVYAAPERVDAALVEHHYRASHQPASRQALAVYLRGEMWTDVEEVLPGLETPVWLAWGRAAAVPPVEDADLWLSRLAGSREEAGIEVFEGSGSLPHAERPAIFCRALDRFISGLPR
ncbi:MAG TPA: alpha/beta fold hydrolase [Thermoanaerobaculia bacterium]|nr:alpha/beta fold hydrolase [Thermoanaerobaculia bacterium]